MDPIVALEGQQKSCVRVGSSRAPVWILDFRTGADSAGTSFAQNTADADAAVQSVAKTRHVHEKLLRRMLLV